MPAAALTLAALAAGCSDEASDDPSGAGGGATTPGTEGAVGGGPDGGAYPPLPPYVVDNTPLSPDYSIFDHGKECFDRFQVEIPAFDCDGPDASRLKISVDGSEVTAVTPAKCDTPSLVGNKYACVPGARVTKFEEVNRYGHTIATVAVCRRSSASPLDSGEFDNIAVLQSDLQNGETCWFQIRQGADFVARNIPAPYSKGRVKGDTNDRRANAVYESPVTLTTDHSECYRCHDSQVFLRTPWISVKNQAPSKTGKVHEIPRTLGVPTYLGKAYRGWNLAANRPKQIKINKVVFDGAFPLSASESAAVAAGKMAPSDACTQCHTIGKSEIASAGQGSCNHFVRVWMGGGPSFSGTVLGSKVSSFGGAFPQSAWMPPAAPSQFASDAAYRGYYARAFSALETCCDDPSQPGCQ
ncbi:MAG: hypothetical protein IPG50_10280 [Myxococcales bacterium]|nr:hypothetical protein [Myxococcales bacterium]